MRDSLGKLRELWQNTSRTNQTMLVAMVVAAVLVGIGFMYMSSMPDYVTLVSNPSPTDSAKIVTLLKEKKITYRITPDGGTIEVPAASRPELRMSLAGAGLMNTGSLGYQLLDKAPFGQTQAMEQETIRRAIEGELENSIQSLDPVSSANVKIAAGDDSPFVNPEKKEASASILVHLKAGQEMNKANVRAVVSLVKCAYTGLSERSISLVDGEGNLLWDGAQQTADTVGSDERQSQERIYKETLAREIQSQLKAAVGPNKSSVIVRAVLNLDKQNETTKTITPGTRVSRTIEEETLKGGGTLSGGRTTAGVAANTGGPANPPTYGGAANVDAGSGNYSHTVSNESMVNGQTETSTVKAPGEVKQLAVAVLLDKSVSPETVSALQQTIETYIGADPTDPNSTRRVTVQSVAFDKSALEAEVKASESAKSAENMRSYVNVGVPLGIMLLMLMLLAKSLKRPATAGQLALASGRSVALAGAGAGAGAMGGGIDMMIGDDLPAGMSVGDALNGDMQVVPISAGDKVHTFEVISEAFDANLESILHLAKSKPETAARLIKSWVSEDK